MHLQGWRTHEEGESPSSALKQDFDLQLRVVVLDHYRRYTRVRSGADPFTPYFILYIRRYTIWKAEGELMGKNILHHTPLNTHPRQYCRHRRHGRTSWAYTCRLIFFARRPLVFLPKWRLAVMESQGLCECSINADDHSLSMTQHRSWGSWTCWTQSWGRRLQYPSFANLVVSRQSYISCRESVPWKLPLSTRFRACKYRFQCLWSRGFAWDVAGTAFFWSIWTDPQFDSTGDLSPIKFPTGSGTSPTRWCFWTGR